MSETLYFQKFRESMLPDPLATRAIIFTVLRPCFRIYSMCQSSSYIICYCRRGHSFSYLFFVLFFVGRVGFMGLIQVHLLHVLLSHEPVIFLAVFFKCSYFCYFRRGMNNENNNHVIFVNFVISCYRQVISLFLYRSL